MNPSTDLKECAQKIAEAKNVIFLSGAGISTSANIPDFRSSGSGLYDQFNTTDLSSPTDIFSLNFYEKNPALVNRIFKKLLPHFERAKPTPTHQFIKFLDTNERLLRHYTQNVDGLDIIAGLSTEKLVESHGHLRSGTCLTCKKGYDIAFLKKAIENDTIPRCECTSVVKPDVVFFGEALPREFSKYKTDWQKCDLLIVAGTSLIVQPFASLIDKVGPGCSRIFVNKTEFSDELFEMRKTDRFFYQETDAVFSKLYKILANDFKFVKSNELEDNNSV